MRLMTLLGEFVVGNGLDCSPLSLQLLQHPQLLTEYIYSHSHCTRNTTSGTCYTLSHSHCFTTTSLYRGQTSTPTSLVRQRQTTSNVQRNTNIHDYRIPTSSEAMISSLGRQLNRRPRRFGSYHHCYSERSEESQRRERISCEIEHVQDACLGG